MTTTHHAITTLAQDIFERAAELKRAGEPFVLATVVWSKRPTSARPGAKAIITADGSLFGWVGGSCAQPSVVAESLRALQDGDSRLLRLDPEGLVQPERPGVRTAPMTCHSGGAIEVFLEPFLPPLQLAVYGESPVADALIRLGHVMGYRTIALRPDALDTAPAETDRTRDGLDLIPDSAGQRTVAVVATMGMYDEDALRAAVSGGAGFVAVVASQRRFDAMRSYLRDSGVSDNQIARIKAPAGLDIHASAPEEIAVSILAEIIARREEILPAESIAGAPPARQVAIDPVCGMEVEIVGAQHVADFQGQRYYFCCPGCKGRFEKRPEQYLAVSVTENADRT
jgi:xanthine dehydrogenase accessory factor